MIRIAKHRASVAIAEVKFTKINNQGIWTITFHKLNWMEVNPSNNHIHGTIPCAQLESMKQPLCFRIHIRIDIHSTVLKSFWNIKMTSYLNIYYDDGHLPLENLVECQMRKMLWIIDIKLFLTVIGAVDVECFSSLVIRNCWLVITTFYVIKI